jgi:hypothetical protein
VPHGACASWAGVCLISVYLIGVHLLDVQLRLEDALETAEDDTVITTVETWLTYFPYQNSNSLITVSISTALNAHLPWVTQCQSRPFQSSTVDVY